MARIKYTALVESIRGSIGGTSFQRNAFGFTVKTKPNMVRPNSTLQSQRKIGFQKALQAWRTLTDTDRANWETYAGTFPTPSKNNPDAYLSGFNLFVRWHTASFQTSDTILANPSGAQGTFLFVEVELIRDGSQFFFILSSEVTNGPWIILVYLTRPLEPTQRYQKGWTRLMARLNWADPASLDIAFAYNRIYGFLPEVGNLIGVDITLYNTTNGQVIYVPSFIQEVIA